MRDVEAERRRLLAAGVSVVRGPQQEPWGLVEMSLFARYRADPTADCAGVLVTRTDRDERDKGDTEPANVLRQGCAL